jgi:hypothetical protein
MQDGTSVASDARVEFRAQDVLLFEKCKVSWKGRLTISGISIVLQGHWRVENDVDHIKQAIQAM